LEAWIDFGRGPLFRLTFSLMVLGLLRVLLLTIAGIVEAYRRNSDRIVPWKQVVRQTAGWLFPIGRLWRKRAVYSSISVLFHVGLLAVPLFLAAHVRLWQRALGWGWPALPQALANWLTLLTVGTGFGLFFGRVFYRNSRALSRFQDYVWPVLLAIPFVTGYACAGLALRPGTYQASMLLHVYSADLIMVMVPFTKIAHCVLTPLSQAVTAVSWKFVPGAGDRVAATLGSGDRPTWVEKARSGLASGTLDDERNQIGTK
jgi:nitrate reductase gamma subunit